MPDPWNPVRATPEPAPIVPRRKRGGRKPSSRNARPREPREASQPSGKDHVGEVDRRGAFGVMLDAVTGRDPRAKPAGQRVPETETKRRRRRLGQPAGKPAKPSKRGSREQRPQSGGSAKQ